MKKITILLTTSLLLFAGFAKAQFFEVVNYAGALSPNSVEDWTKGWTNWTPKATSYGAVADSTTLNGMITGTPGELIISTTVTLNASTVYSLKGMIVIKTGGDLIVPAGTVIRCKGDLLATPKNYATIVVERGGKIHLNGTSSNPVVFTSWKNTGRDRGDWGGILLAGYAENNQGTDVQMEGFSNVAFDNTLTKYGRGSNAAVENDNSGSITFTRIEFGGTAFEANKEINGLTFCSVGSGTLVNGVQVSYSGDDSYEWFGGSVRCKYLIAYKGTDDDFDTDFGYHGAVQFGIGARDSAYFDLTYAAPSGASTSEGFESDNDAAGSGKLPYTTAVFSNMTMVGPVPVGYSWNKMNSTAKNAFRRGARIRRNSRLSIVNSIFTGYRNTLMLDGDSVLKFSGANTGTFPTDFLFRNNVVVNSDSGYVQSSPWKRSADGLVEVAVKDSSSLSAYKTWVKAATNSNKINPVAFAAGTLLVDPNNATTPDFRPVAASPALGMTNYTFSRMDEYGRINSVNTIAAISDYNVYPNPAVDKLNVDLIASNAFTANVKMMDLSGKTIRNFGSVNMVAGSNSIESSLVGIQNGIYLFVISGNGANLTTRVVVNK